MIQAIKNFFNKIPFSFSKSGARDTYYDVNRDGKLVLCRHELLKSGRMDRQIKAARELKKMSEQSSKKD